MDVLEIESFHPSQMTGRGVLKALIDNKKSGDYLIYATRHMFKDERYDIKLFCIKFASYNRQDIGSYLDLGKTG